MTALIHPPMPASTDFTGQTIAGGRYRVDQRLGAGSMGYVFRAWDRNLETNVVIKVPTLARLENEEFRKRFLQESRFLVKLTHPNIVRVLDIGEHGSVPYFVMQFVGGGSLEALIYANDAKSKALPQSIDEIAEWLPATAEALDFVNQRGLIHRDVKPANILFDEFGHAYLSDFGLSRLLHPDEENSRMTAAGAVVGTPNYVAPEVVLGKPSDGRADQYSLAMTVYEAMTGKLPLQGATPSATMVNQTAKMPPAPSHYNPAISPELDRVILQALSKPASRRFGSSVEFCTALLEAAGIASNRSGGGSNPEIPTTRPTSPAKSRVNLPVESSRSSARPSGDTAVAPVVARYTVKKTCKAKKDGSANCPKCNHPLRLKPKHAGQKAQCVKCKSLLVIAKNLKEVKHVIINKRAGGAALTEADFATVLGKELFGWKLSAAVAVAIACLTVVIVLTSVARIGYQAAQQAQDEKPRTPNKGGFEGEKLDD
jgi:serine/threonine protein kinase